MSKRKSKSAKKILGDIVDAEYTEDSSPRKNNDALIVHWNGRFGNRMHTYSYAHARAKKFGGELYLPSQWEGDLLFNLDHKIIEDESLRLHLNQSIQPFDNLDYRAKQIKEFNQRNNHFNFRYVNADNPSENFKKYDQAVFLDSVSAYHSSIFKNMFLEDVLKLYQFSDKVKNLDVYKMLEDKQGTYDIAHLRRDDISNTKYKNNGGYSVISKDSYNKAFKKYGYDPEKIEWTSDDWSKEWGVGNPYSSGFLKKRGKWNYPIGSEYMEDVIFDWFPDFLRLYFARSIFRANSSFSWWACTLAKGRETPPSIFSPRIDKRILYAREETFKEEAEFDFEEGNQPHWLCITGKDECEDIIYADE